MKPLVLAILLLSPLAADDIIPSKFQGLWLPKKSDGKPYIVLIKPDGLEEIDCTGQSMLTEVEREKNDCFAFHDPGVRICFSVKGKTLTWKQELESKWVKSDFKKFDGTLESYKKKICPGAKKAEKLR